MFNFLRDSYEYIFTLLSRFTKYTLISLKCKNTSDYGQLTFRNQMTIYI